MKAPTVDLNVIAAELGMSPERVAEHLREAIAAGLLVVVEDDGETVTLASALPGDRS